MGCSPAKSICVCVEHGGATSGGPLRCVLGVQDGLLPSASCPLNRPPCVGIHSPSASAHWRRTAWGPPFQRRRGSTPAAQSRSPSAPAGRRQQCTMSCTGAIQHCALLPALCSHAAGAGCDSSARTGLAMMRKMCLAAGIISQDGEKRPCRGAASGCAGSKPLACQAKGAALK